MITTPLKSLMALVEQAQKFSPIRVAVVDAAQAVVLETLRQAHALGLVEPALIGVPQAIVETCDGIGWKVPEEWIVSALSDPDAVSTAVEFVRSASADAIMKGHIHTDTLMRTLLDKDRGLRVPGRRASHVFLVEVSTHPKLLGITDAAINIAPDLNAKSEILRNAIELFHLLGVVQPKVAVLSAIETVNPAIVSTVDAACLALMARRGQINGALVDGPLAFDNAISATAAKEKGIVSGVSGDVDILLVPDLVSGNLLAKNLEYLAGAVAAGVALGLAVPVVLSSRADPPASRLAALALAVLMHRESLRFTALAGNPPERSLMCAPQPEHACCSLPA